MTTIVNLPTADITTASNFVFPIVNTSLGAPGTTEKLALDQLISRSTGYIGSVGYTGSIGDVGYTGSIGGLGYTGSIGGTGPLGFTGSVGPIGFTGLPGYTGSRGAADAIGYTGSSGLPTRSQVTVTTDAVVNGGTVTVDATVFNSYALLALQSSDPARIRGYVTSNARTQDLSRPRENSPAANSGLIFEIITTGPETKIFSPSVVGFNYDNPLTGKLYLTVTNDGGTAAEVALTLTVVRLEN